jgi:hypothetical protein
MVGYRANWRIAGGFAALLSIESNSINLLV